jgi:hypothetical protein
MLLRLMPNRGGDGTVHGIITMNDIGSDVLSLFYSNLQYLGNRQGYTGWRGVIPISYVNGAIQYYARIKVEVQLVRDDNIPWSDWIEELAIVKPDSPGLLRLFRLWNQECFVSEY